MGNSTIDVVDLNNFERAVKIRFEVGESIQSSLEGALDKLEIYKQNRSTRSRNRLLGHVEGLLKECLPTSQYAATSASLIHSDPNYQELKNNMISHGLWTGRLQQMHEESEGIKLDFN